MSEANITSEPIRVGVLGARGRMGTQVCKAVDADPGTELVAMTDAGEWVFEIADAGAQVVVDFTQPDVVMDNIRWCIDQGISVVVGTSGWLTSRPGPVTASARSFPASICGFSTIE